jgi:hypothetical protein
VLLHLGDSTWILGVDDCEVAGTARKALKFNAKQAVSAL